jgi:hypothetical protein
VRRLLIVQPGPLTRGSGLRISIDCEACTRRFGSNVGSPLKVLVPPMRSAKFMTSWSVPVEGNRGDWLSKNGWTVIPLKPRTTGYVGKAANDGSKNRVERTVYENEAGDVPSSEEREEVSETTKRKREQTLPYTNCFSDVFAPIPTAYVSRSRLFQPA